MLKIRTLTFFGLIYRITLFACKKSNSPAQAKSLIGTWIWFQTYCDCPGPPTTPDSVGYQDILTFKSDHTWKRVQKNIQIDSLIEPGMDRLQITARVELHGIMIV
jgi:hypothetical protein